MHPISGSSSSSGYKLLDNELDNLLIYCYELQSIG